MSHEQQEAKVYEVKKKCERKLNEFQLLPSIIHKRLLRKLTKDSESEGSSPCVDKDGICSIISNSSKLVCHAKLSANEDDDMPFCVAESSEGIKTRAVSSKKVVDEDSCESISPITLNSSNKKISYNRRESSPFSSLRQISSVSDSDDDLQYSENSEISATKLEGRSYNGVAQQKDDKFKSCQVKSEVKFADSSRDIKPHYSLKAQIKKTNRKHASELESLYHDETPKHSMTGIRLAKLYLNGKQVERNEAAARKILDASTLPEAKYLLMKLCVETERYTDAYHYSKYLDNAKCNCIEKVSKPASSSKKVPNMEHVKNASTSLNILEGHQLPCFRHQAQTLKASIVDIVGEAAANRFSKEGSDLSYAPPDLCNDE